MAGQFFNELFHLKKCTKNDDTFIGEFQHIIQASGNVFGGHTVAYATKAALMTVEQGKYLISSVHCSFVRPGKKGPVYFHVTRVKDGQTFCFRNVVGTQGDKPIVTCMVSFKSVDSHDQSNELSHNKLPIPLTERELEESVPSSLLLGSNYNDLGRINQDYFLLESRYHNPPKFWYKRLSNESKLTEYPKLEPRQILWMKPWFPIGSTDPNDHRLAILYGTDTGPSSSIFLKHWSSFLNLDIIGSLDHLVHFHTDEHIRFDQWLLFDTECNFSASGTTLNNSRVYSHSTGNLIATATQQAYIRLKPRL